MYQSGFGQENRFTMLQKKGIRGYMNVGGSEGVTT